MNYILKIFTSISEFEGITIGALEKDLGASKGVLSRAINKGTDVQSKWLVSLVEKYPKYNYDKMLRGEFSSYYDDKFITSILNKAQGVNEPARSYTNSNEIEIILRQQLADKDKIIQMLEEKIEDLTGSSRKGLAG